MTSELFYIIIVVTGKNAGDAIQTVMDFQDLKKGSSTNIIYKHIYVQSRKMV